MKLNLRSKIFLLLLDIIVVCFCAAGIYSIHLKAKLPFGVTSQNNFLVIENISVEDVAFSKDQIINSIDRITFNNWEEVELYLDGKNIGDDVEISIDEDGNNKLVKATLTGYYTSFDLTVFSIIGLFFIVFGILVRTKASKNKSAELFHLASLGLAMVVTMTAGNYLIGPFGYGYANRILWLVAYSFTPVLFIHFTLSFVKATDEKLKWVLRILYIAAGINVIVLSYFFFDAALNYNVYSIKNYVLYYDSFFRLFQIGCIVMAISVCIYAYKRASSIEERKRLQWLILGFFIGPFSFVVLWILPIILIGQSLLPESLVQVLLIAIPITFSIAIVKYHLMDIHLLVRRSLVYSIILATIILTYIGVSSLITLFVKDVNPAFPSVLTAIAAVFALQPVKTAIQKFVDKKFFRVEYDFREEQKKFLDDIKSSLDVQTLAEKIVTQTNSLIPVENIGFFILSTPDNRIKMIANKGWDFLRGRSLIRFEEEKLKTDLSNPVALVDRVEPGVDIEAADVRVFKRWGMVLVFPIKSLDDYIHGFLALGEKKAGQRFLKDDVDLLNGVTTAAALAIDRIKYHEDLIRKQLEAERLKELHRVKSRFVQMFTHELKNPLTGLKLHAELLQMELERLNVKSSAHFKYIDGESDRLNRLIENILDTGKIEKGMKSYELQKIQLNEILCMALNEVQYQARLKKQSVDIINAETQYYVNGDSEAIESAILNILTNAIKYSEKHTTINVFLTSQDNRIGVKVQDSGKGIEKSQLGKIFDPYYRSENEAKLKEKGTGLGLAIVKHIMDAHNGQVEVESEIGKGSTFTLWFQEIIDE